jgi:hypothetical protein
MANKSTPAARQRKRRDQLNEAAQALGFQTWAKFETALINRDGVMLDEKLASIYCPIIKKDKAP